MDHQMIYQAPEYEMCWHEGNTWKNSLVNQTGR